MTSSSTSKQQYTIKELAKLWDRSDATINRKIKKYSLELDKDYVDGRLVNVIFLSEEEFNTIQSEIQLEDEKRTSRPAMNVNSSQLDDVERTSSPQVINQDTTVQLVAQINQLVGTVSQLAENSSYTSEQLGQYKERCLMIEDKQKQSEGDAKHWQDKYHEAQHIIEALEKELLTTRQALEAERKKPFWKRNVI